MLYLHFPARLHGVTFNWIHTGITLPLLYSCIAFHDFRTKSLYKSGILTRFAAMPEKLPRQQGVLLLVTYVVYMKWYFKLDGDCLFVFHRRHYLSIISFWLYIKVKKTRTLVFGSVVKIVFLWHSYFHTCHGTGFCHFSWRISALSNLSEFTG